MPKGRKGYIGNQRRENMDSLMINNDVRNFYQEVKRNRRRNTNQNLEDEDGTKIKVR